MRTQEAYVAAVEQLAKYYHKPPDEIGEEELRQYLLYLQNEKGVSASTTPALTVALCGLKFLYQHTLQREWRLLDLARAKQEKSLPAVLSVEEVARVLGCVHQPRYRARLTTIYACGLRIQEGVYLQVGDIDGRRRILKSRSRACSGYTRSGWPDIRIPFGSVLKKRCSTRAPLFTPSRR